MVGGCLQVSKRVKDGETRQLSQAFLAHKIPPRGRIFCCNERGEGLRNVLRYCQTFFTKGMKLEHAHFLLCNPI